jgi:hypothetical protein
MNEPQKPTLAPAPKTLTEVDYLRQIAEYLKSIRSMLNFFTIIIVLAIVLQACSVLSTFLGQ